jgi:hypothetical protein
MLCLSCHSLGGPMNDIVPLTKNYTPFGMEAFLSALGVHNPYMPPFAGTAAERGALAHFISYGIHGKQGLTPAASPVPTVDPMPFDPAADEYLLLAWISGGALCLGDGGEIISLGLPTRTINAQLIHRDEAPEVVISNVQLQYRLNNQKTAMAKGEDFGVFIANLQAEITQAGLIEVEALGTDGTVLATTTVALPAAQEMGCYNCHGGEKSGGGGPAFTEATARNILAAHDKFNKTSLVASLAEYGKVECQNCHLDRPEGGGSDMGPLTLSAVIHSFHTTYLAGRAGDACAACHTGAGTGQRVCMSGIHQQVGLDCTNCHGTLEEHSASLLKGIGSKNPRAAQLMDLVDTDGALGDVKGRRPWVNEPDCLTCHVDYEPPETDSALNGWNVHADVVYNKRYDESGSVRCIACHGPQHRLYPNHDGAASADNAQPLQYQGNTLVIGSNMNCAVCHKVEMEDSLHHANMERLFRNEP